MSYCHLVILREPPGWCRSDTGCVLIKISILIYQHCDTAKTNSGSRIRAKPLFGLLLMLHLCGFYQLLVYSLNNSWQQNVYKTLFQSSQLDAPQLESREERMLITVNILVLSPSKRRKHWNATVARRDNAQLLVVLGIQQGGQSSYHTVHVSLIRCNLNRSYNYTNMEPLLYLQECYSASILKVTHMFCHDIRDVHKTAVTCK